MGKNTFLGANSWTHAIKAAKNHMTTIAANTLLEVTVGRYLVFKTMAKTRSTLIAASVNSEAFESHRPIRREVSQVVQYVEKAPTTSAAREVA